MSSLNQIDVVTTSSGLTTSTTAYSDGDILGAEMQFDMGTNTYGLILAATLTDVSDVIGAVDLFLYDRSVAVGSDNAAPSISDADILFSRPTISFPYPFDMGGARQSSLDSLSVPVKANASGIVYGRLVTRSGHTFFGAATALQVLLSFSNDV